MRSFKLSFNLLLFFALAVSFQAFATGVDPGSAPPSPSTYIDNAIKSNANLNGTGGSVSTAGSAVVIQGVKTGTSLSIEGATANQAKNVSTGGGSGSASAGSAVQGIKTGELGGVGVGQVGVQLVSNAAAGKNQASTVDTGGKATVTVDTTNGVLTEVKNSVAQIDGTGNVTGNVTAAATFNTVKLQSVNLPALTIPKCPTL